MKTLTLTIFTGLVLVLLQSTPAHADVYAVGSSGNIYSTVNIDKTNYIPGESIVVTTSIYSQNPSTLPVNLTTTTTGNTVQTVISQSISNGVTIYGNATLVAPSSPGAYTADFVTGVDETIVQNYSYSSDGGAIYGVCDVVVHPGGGSPTYTAHRDAATEQSATGRGVTRAVVQFEITTDNSGGPCSRWLEAEFYPGALSAPATFTDGQDPRNFCSYGSNYCSQIMNADGHNDVVVQEYF